MAESSEPSDVKQHLGTSDEVLGRVENLEQQNRMMNNRLHDAELSERLYHNPPLTAFEKADYVEDLGLFINPVHSTLKNHHHLVLNRYNQLSFGVAQSPLDLVAAYVFKDPAFSEEGHPNFFDYEPLRDNVAIVRNYVMEVLSERSDLDNAANRSAALKMLDGMGFEIGRALQRGSKEFSISGRRLSPLEASQPGDGAVAIYQLLLQKQEDNKGPFHFLKKGFGRDYSSWKLPSLEDSAFSSACVQEFKEYGLLNNGDVMRAQPGENMEGKINPIYLDESGRLSPDAQAMVQQPVIAAPPPAEQNSAERFAVLGSTLAGAAMSLERVMRLPKPVKEEAVQLARDILDKLKLGMGNAAPRDEWMMRPAEEVLEESKALTSVAAEYADVFNTARTLNPHAAQDPVLLQANESLGKLAYLVKEQSVQAMEKEGRIAEAEMLRAEMAIYPESWKQVDDIKMGDLIQQLKNGLELSQALVNEALADGVQLVPSQLQAPHDANSPIDPAVLASSVAKNNLALQQRLQQSQQTAQTPAAAPKPVVMQVPAGLERLSPTDLAALKQMGMGNGISRGNVVEPVRPSHAQTVGRRQQETMPIALPKPTPDYRSAEQQPRAQEGKAVR